MNNLTEEQKIKYKACNLLSNLMKELSTACVEGVSGLDLEIYAKEYMQGYHCIPFNLNYHPKWANVPYPNILCISVNNVIAHGIPNDVKFVSGDLVNIDTALVYDGQCADAALMVGVGEVSHPDHNLIRFAKKVLYAGISKIKPGATNWDVSSEMYYTAMKYNLKTNVRFSGHGIGKEMHMLPKIPAFPIIEGSPDEVNVPRYEFKVGDVVCLEPMVTRGRDMFGVMDKDGWTCRTSDGKKSAMFEHMVEVTKEGYKVLTTHFDETE